MSKALDEMVEELRTTGDRVVMFVPYIPLMTYFGTDAPAPGWGDFVPYGCGGSYASAKEIAYAEKVNASGERNIWLSGMIRNFARLENLAPGIIDAMIETALKEARNRPEVL